MEYADFGSISSGTLSPDDLIPAFTNTLEALLRKQSARFSRSSHRALIRQARGVLRRLTKKPTEMGFVDLNCVLHRLYDALNEFAPPYGRFGAHEGDGADIGFWLMSESIEEDVRDGVLLRVSDMSEVPSAHRGPVLLVNDHGNMTLYHCVGQRAVWWRAVWSVV